MPGSNICVTFLLTPGIKGLTLYESFLFRQSKNVMYISVYMSLLWISREKKTKYAQFNRIKYIFLDVDNLLLQSVYLGWKITSQNTDCVFTWFFFGAYYFVAPWTCYFADLYRLIYRGTSSHGLQIFVADGWLTQILRRNSPYKIENWLVLWHKRYFSTLLFLRFLSLSL